jgi:hypothetical protein
VTKLPLDGVSRCAVLARRCRMPCPQGMPGILLRDGRRLRHGHTFVGQGADYGAFHDEGDRPGAPGLPRSWPCRVIGRKTGPLGPAELERAARLQT